MLPLKSYNEMNYYESESLRDFLKRLDEADVTVSDWEAGFIESNLTREHFSEKQREIVLKLMEKYSRRIE